MARLLTEQWAMEWQGERTRGGKVAVLLVQIWEISWIVTRRRMNKGSKINRLQSSQWQSVSAPCYAEIQTKARAFSEHKMLLSIPLLIPPFSSGDVCCCYFTCEPSIVSLSSLVQKILFSPIMDCPWFLTASNYDVIYAPLIPHIVKTVPSK